MQLRRFSADRKSRIPGPHRGLYGVPIQLDRPMPSAEESEDLARRFNGLPLLLDRPTHVVAPYLEPHGAMDEHHADVPILFLVTEGRGHVPAGGPDGLPRIRYDIAVSKAWTQRGLDEERRAGTERGKSWFVRAAPWGRTGVQRAGEPPAKHTALSGRDVIPPPGSPSPYPPMTLKTRAPARPARAATSCHLGPMSRSETLLWKNRVDLMAYTSTISCYDVIGGWLETTHKVGVTHIPCLHTISPAVPATVEMAVTTARRLSSGEHPDDDSWRVSGRAAVRTCSVWG